MALQAAVVGTTRWGTTLALLLARCGASVTLWARDEEEAVALREDGKNQARLPGHSFPSTLSVTSDPERAFTSSEMIVIAVPSAKLRDNVQRLAPLLSMGAIIVCATKGMERGSGNRMSQVISEELGEETLSRYCVLSGPNLSEEVAQGLPTTTVVAAREEAVAKRVQEAFTSRVFRVYTSADVVGVEFGGALKNIIAVGAGMADGMGYGDNGKAAFISRGIAEITRLGVAAGADPLTFSGLACLGDLVATCYSSLSRNRYVGQELGKGRKLSEVLAEMGQVVEGVDTTPAALVLAERLGVEMPITQATYSVIFEGLEPRRALEGLLTRALRPENPLWAGRDET